MQLARFSVTAPYSLKRTAGAYARFPEELVDIFADGRFRRCLLFDGEPVLLDAVQPGDSLDCPVEISVLTPTNRSQCELKPLADIVARMLALVEPIESVYELMESDPRLQFLSTTLHGLRRTVEPSPFEGLVSSILAQLISIRGAAVIRGRLVQQFGQRVTHEGQDYWTFLEPDAVHSASVDQLCKIGMTGAKARAILAVANASLAGEVDLDQLSALPDREVIRHLTTLPGIGQWTAEWFLINVLGRMTIVPSGDLGVRRTTGKWLMDGAMPSPDEVRKFYEPFGEQRAYIAYYVLSAERYRLERPAF